MSVAAKKFAGRYGVYECCKGQSSALTKVTQVSRLLDHWFKAKELDAMGEWCKSGEATADKEADTECPPP